MKQGVGKWDLVLQSLRLVGYFMFRVIILSLMLWPVMGMSAADDYAWNIQFQEKLIKANAGDAREQFNVGIMYLNGQGTPIDAPRAFEWVKKSADKGYIKAKFKLGYFYLKGIGVEKNLKKAEALLRETAFKKHPSAQFYMAHLYIKGLYLDKNYRKAMIWLKRAKKNGYWKAEDEIKRLQASL